MSQKLASPSMDGEPLNSDVTLGLGGEKVDNNVAMWIPHPLQGTVAGDQDSGRASAPVYQL